VKGYRYRCGMSGERKHNRNDEWMNEEGKEVENIMMVE